MNPDDEKYGSTGEVLNDVVEETLRGPERNEPDEPRDPTWLRWMKFTAIIVVLAFVLGLINGSLFFMSEYRAVQNDVAEKSLATEAQVSAELRNKVLTGAGIGAGLGLIYVVRCIFRKVDP